MRFVIFCQILVVINSVFVYNNTMKSFNKICVVALCAVLVFFFTGCIGTGANNQNLSVMIEGAFPKVVSIECFSENNHPRVATETIPGRQSAGSGVIIYSSPEFSLIATNAHVIENDGKNNLHNFISIIHWSARLYAGGLNTFDHSNSENGMGQFTSYPRNNRLQIATNGVRNQTVVVYYNHEADLAIIKCTNIRPEFRNVAPASLRTTSLRVGEPVAALGYSLGTYYRASVGVVTQVFPVFPNRNFVNAFMHDATAIQGNSGGPVFDANGEVVGLTTAVALSSVLDKDNKPKDDNVVAFGFSIAISSIHINEELMKILA